MGGMPATVEELRLRLQEIAEELADLAHNSLRAAVKGADAHAAAQEKLFTRARRSVLKAISILGTTDSDPDWEA